MGGNRSSVSVAPADGGLLHSLDDLERVISMRQSDYVNAFNMLSIATMVQTLNSVETTLPIVNELIDLTTEFASADTSATAWGINNPVVYTLFLLIV